MPKASVNGVELNYRQVGEGEDVVFIHGLAANHAFWNLRLLLPVARHFQATTYDLRGHGYSSMPKDGYTSLDMVTDLVALLDELQIEKAHLVGHSFGGVIAVHAAALYPERVRSLTIQDSRLRALQPSQRMKDWPDWRDAQEKLRRHGIDIDENADEVGVLLLEKLASPEWRARREKLAQEPLFVPFAGWSAGNRSATRWLELLRTTSARRDISELAGLARQAIASIRHPTLAIYGERSRCFRTYDGLGKVLPQAKRIILDNAGHFYPVIKPAAVAELLLEFLLPLRTRAKPAARSVLVPAAPASRGMA